MAFAIVPLLGMTYPDLKLADSSIRLSLQCVECSQSDRATTVLMGKRLFVSSIQLDYSCLSLPILARIMQMCVSTCAVLYCVRVCGLEKLVIVNNK